MKRDLKTQFLSSIAVLVGVSLMVAGAVVWFLAGELNPILAFIGVPLALFGALYGLVSDIRAIRGDARGKTD
ncbi:hypothetical protein [Microbacterium sp. P05]|uniref:hypothetical protein n=1 Tax=Microbacterium sp. P05 TaxID=3366948 RepID=UPI0037473EA8